MYIAHTCTHIGTHVHIDKKHTYNMGVENTVLVPDYLCSNFSSTTYYLCDH
jgi:hypothetical protein